VTGEQLLVAAGRTPQVDGLGLDTVGVDADGYIQVDAHLRVPGRDWLYVIGDLNGHAKFTHMAKYQAAIAADHVLGKDWAVEHLGNGHGSPRMIFTDPQVGAVGHTTDSAAKAGLRPRVVDVGTSANAGGSYYGRNARGTSRFLIDEDRGVIVGATITGSEVVDLLHGATIAVVSEVPLTRLRHAVPAFPTRSEIWLYLFNELGL
jgi:pyruvate/2-oxoglutarate dehydrogenase complex dihydrolipoamide dehydrogenase (E3) component